VSHVGGKTRLDIAKESLKWIVSNSELNKGANFGLMTWDRRARKEVDIGPEGANRIYNTIDAIKANCPWSGCTNIGAAMSWSQGYLSVPGKLKIDDCQKTALIVLSDGAFNAGISQGNNLAKELYDRRGISTFVVSLASGTQQTHKDLAKAGGTYTDDGDDTNDYSPIEVANKQKLIDALIDLVRLSIDDNKSTFTKPVLIEESQDEDYIYQSTFEYVKSHQWKGYLKKYKLKKGIPENQATWDAAKILNARNASDRKIWTIANIYGIDTSLNNFVSSNSADLEFLLWKYAAEDPTDTEVKNLINFVRGVDVYNEVTESDEQTDGLVSGERWKLADIYHSEMKVVGPPSAAVDQSNANTEAYYRAANEYDNFVNGNECGGSCRTRKQVVYVGANDGLLHAFNSKNGEEMWAFMPPMKLRDIRKIISNKDKESHSIYGVDGSPIIKDVYYNKKWRTVLLAGLGRGGGGYFALDVTDPDTPSFLFAFRNDLVNKIISHWDSDGDVTEVGYGGDDFAKDFEYDYSKIGDSTSTPQILLIPYKDTQKWVAVFGAGFNAGVNSTYGSSIYVIDLENDGKVLQRIDISDTGNNDIANSIPAAVLAITPDSTPSADYKGAMIYFADLESSLWKLNLTDQGTLFDTTQIFSAESSFANDRMEFFQTTASIDSAAKLWLYYGTGNQQKLQRMSSSIENRIYGIKGLDYPQFAAVKNLSTIKQLKDTTLTSASCPSDADLGWYVNLDKNEKITGQLAIFNETIFASRYIPNDQDVCSVGNGVLSEHDFMCGNVLRKNKLGEGIPTGAVAYKGKIYLGISGDASGEIKDKDGIIGQRKKNLVVLNPTKGLTVKDAVSLESWREIW